MFERDLLKGRNILITGGGTGLGRSMALRFAELGANLFLVARREEPLAQTANDIRGKGVKAGYATCDVRDFAAVENAIAAAEKELGAVDTLVNNAAGNFIARTEKLSPNAFNAVIGIVLQGTFHFTLGLGRRWIEGKQPGNILNIVATYAAVGSGSGFVVPSACAKAGVLAMTRSLAVEWAPKVRVNALSAGLVATEAADDHYGGAEGMAAVAATVPLGRFGTPGDMAGICLFLASPLAAYVTGANLVAHGGGERPAYLTAAEAVKGN